MEAEAEQEEAEVEEEPGKERRWEAEVEEAEEEPLDMKRSPFLDLKKCIHFLSTHSRTCQTCSNWNRLPAVV